MIVALSLLSYALTLAVAGPRLLRAGSWADRSPRLAIAAWQALTVTVLASAALAGLALTFPTMTVSADLAELLRACVMAIREQYASPGGAAAGATGAVLSLAILGRTMWCLGSGLAGMARERTRHSRILDVVGHTDTHRDVVVLDSAEPAVYCLPGRRRRTVVTIGALQALDEAQLDAVLAHEHAHLTERHDLILGLARALASAFPAVALFRTAAEETARLIELRADDAAAARSGRLTVAAALLAVATGSIALAPAVALAAGGAGAAARVRRLIPPHQPLGSARTAAGSLAVAALFALPVLLLGGPAAAAAGQNLCPDGYVSTSTTAL
ncbi:M56 family metallopeptidase [Pseudarthrobacter sp. AL07]|uniref:M56 family metallopeptidase n=1 Tax=unclassified Pseudarthrobacter TaxID=2647000 RepID=UPI00249C82D6|nr:MULTISPECIES: M56 family metallopeptidase [unclassified Pseudarthrobacter]MDI3195229.1 M56 family metallopeptidase [Pseudarthrobacter sp. AL20]MDI3209295.1 M56 family metallopeptidase [Pseudarthrobacter sp. AL07]